jgi:ubiquinone/menaquinone biosynthesis C-methylase UbiE
MSYFDEQNATEDELWNWCRLEYGSSNALVKMMIENYYEKIKDIIKVYFRENMTVLEVGCGAAESSDKIFKMLNGQQFVISDYDIRYVNKIREHKPYLKVSQESVYELKRAENSFDAVFFLEVLEHLENYELALSELFRVSKEYVIIAVPNEPLWRLLNLARLKYIKDGGNTPGHINHWSLFSLTKLISKYGKIIRYYQPLPWIILLVKKQ